jgi:hypothetical protein
LTLTAAGLLAGCAQTRHSTPLQAGLAGAGVRLQRSLPSVLPGGAQALAGRQLVLLPAESAAGMLVPVPFLSEAIEGAINRAEAASEAARLAAVDPYAMAQVAWDGAALLSASADALVLQPFAFLQACVDDRYRIALVHQLSRGDWMARYTVHLASSHEREDFHRPTAALLQTLQTEMQDGTAMLRRLVERGARGELSQAKRRVDVGSLHLVGNRAAGLVNPMLVLARGAQLIEEDDSRVLVRIDGDPSQPASAGGLFFGVHLLRKAQLHTFRPAANAA